MILLCVLSTINCGKKIAEKFALVTQRSTFVLPKAVQTETMRGFLKVCQQEDKAQGMTKKVDDFMEQGDK